MCQLQRIGDDTYALKIRVPDRLLSAGDDKHLVVRSVAFGFDRDALNGALDANTALTWRLHRDERGWRAFMSFNHQLAETVTLDATHGAIGLDFNVDHLSVIARLGSTSLSEPPQTADLLSNQGAAFN